jgi:hypothetical protein
MARSPKPARDASAAIAGYVYQVSVTVQRWLNLGANEHLELEAGEDIDIVRRARAEDASEAERDVEQVHRPARPLSLRSKKARQAIVNFCGHRIARDGVQLKFRFLTTANAAREAGATEPGIVLWEGVRTAPTNTPDELAAVERIRQRLSGGTKPKGVTADEWESFKAILADSSPERLTDVIRGFEWAMGQGDSQSFRVEASRRLSEMRPGQSPAIIARIFTHLFAHVFWLLSQSGPKILTTESLASELNAPSVSEEDRLTAEWLLRRLDEIEGRLTELEETVNRHLTEEHPKTFFEATASGREQGAGSLFNFDQVFRGRQAHLQALDQLLDTPEALIAVLFGRGGIGKTKLLRDWSGSRTAWKVLWTNESRPWQPTTDREIPAQDTLLIADDAHRYPHLAQLIGMASRWRGPHKLKLVIGSRPSGRSYVNEKLAQFVDESSLIRCVPLQELTQQDTVDLAAEMLGSNYQHLATQLAAVSWDAPLVTVVGGRLIARGEIIPGLLGNHESFQRAVFDKFASECIGKFQTGGKPKEDLLHLIAALQPVNEQEQKFDTKAQEFLGWKSYEIRRNALALEEIGIAIRRRDAIRIVPDVLADYLLEQASVGPNHYLTGYPDAVFEAFHDSHLTNLLQNLAELDWRITQRDPETRLLENVWVRIRETFRAQKARPRRELLSALAGAAPFQPQAVHTILQIAMDEQAETSYEYGFRVTSDDALRHLPELLTATLFDERTSADSFRRLWSLSQTGAGELQGRARRALEEAIGYKKYKSLTLNERVLSQVEGLALDPGAYASDFTPLDIVENLLDREIGHTEQIAGGAGAFSVSSLPVNYENVRPLRERALAVVERCLSSGRPSIEVAAVDVLSKVLSEFRPNMRNRADAEEERWQDSERLRALEILDNRIQGGSLSLSLVWRIQKLLFWVIERGRLLSRVKDAATKIHEALVTPQLFEVFDVICSDEWEYNTVEDEFVSVSTRRREKEDRGVAELRAHSVSVNEQIATVEVLAREALDAGVSLKSLESFLTTLCQRREFLQAFSEYLLTKDRSALFDSAGVIVPKWRQADLALFSRYCTALASHSWRAAASIARYLGPHLEQPIGQDVEILTVLASRTEPPVVAHLLLDLSRLGRIQSHRSIAMRLILSVDIGDSSFLASTLCEIVGPMRLSPAFFDEYSIRGLLEKLVTHNELPKETFATFIASIGGRAPLEVVRFFQNRLEHAAALGTIQGYSPYEAFPSFQGWSSFQGLRESNQYRAALVQIFGMLRRFPDHCSQLIDLFWRFGTTDEVTFSVLDDFLRSPVRDDLVDVINLLTDAPKNLALNHADFAVRVLNACAGHSAELGQAAFEVLRGTCLSLGSGGFAMGGGSIPLYTGVSERATAILATCEANSPAHRLYSELAGVMPSHLSLPAPRFDDED